jgi:PAS domain S-box-containing protein
MMLDTLLILSLVVSGLFMAGLGLLGKRFSGRVPAALPYALLMGAAAAWAFLYALELLAGSLPLKILFHDLRFIFITFIPFLELWLVIAYVRKTAWLSREWGLLLVIIPALVSILALTSSYHTLFQYNFSIDSSGPIQVLQYQEGPIYPFYLLYSLAILIVAYIILINESRKQGTLGEIRTVLLLIALILPTVINFLFTAGITPVSGLNLTPILLWIPAILYTVAIFRYRFLDIVPIARDRLIGTMNTPMLVLDRDGRIVDHNPAAHSFFPTPDGALGGKQIGEVVRDWPEFLEICGSENGGTFHLARAGDEGRRSYIASVDRIRTPGGEPEGHLIILSDITDQKKTEDALQESERKYQALYRDARVGLFETRLPGATIVACNRMFADLFGFTSPEEAVGQDMGGFYTEPAGYDRVSRQIHETGQIDNQVVHFHNKMTGNMFWGQFTLRANREREVAEGTIVDITKQHEAEEQLWHIASFPQLNPDLILEVDRSGRVLFVNPAMEEALRRTESPDPRVFIPSGCLDRVNRDPPGGRMQWKSEISFGGRTYEETLYYTPEFDTLRIYASDITGKKQAEDALHWANAYLGNLIDHANAPIIVWDPGYTITRFNHAFEHLTGRTEQEVLGQTLDILFPEESKNASLALIEKTLKGEQWESVEIPILHRDGYRRIVLWNSATIYASDGRTVLATIAQGQDITERKQAEEAREALLKELEQKNAELERFTYTVSHDLKSPLITIRGFLGLLREDALKGDTLQMDWDIIRISSAAEKMQELLSDLLTLSRVGRITSPPEQVNFGTIAEEARELLAGSIREQRVTVTIAPDLPDVFVDRIRIREVLANLIENAIKFRGEREPRVEIGVLYGGEKPVFYVQDNGVGIEPEYLTRIFGLFEKLDPKSEGTGIGLAIVKRIIEVHGGKIWVESPGPGQGTTFWFTLPPGGNRC